jgi:hypothetical protein
MKIKLIKYHPQFAYSVGDVFEVNDRDTEILLSGNYAEPVGVQEPPTIDTPEANMPKHQNASNEFSKQKKQHNKK